MKRFLIIMFLFISVSFAQSIDTLNLTSSDSIDLREIVQKQIDEALQKKSATQYVENPNYQNTTVQKVNRSSINTNNAQVNVWAKLFNRLSLQYKIYLLLSLLIVITVLLRRSILQFKRKSIKKFKERIALLREEKIGGSIVNQKKRQIRLTLKDNPITLKQNEKEIALNAKQLNISKGELLLAARLKLLEVSKAQRSI